jgi:2-polyprenyl-6-methoxyphenol hydroxylase-like FAD-dependent oxidoreductase
MSESITSHSATLAVAGAGPVGLSLAIEAARRGLDVVVIELREPREPPSAKCNTVGARTMETFRRFGIATEVRAAGLPDDYPTDVLFCTALTGHEITRIRLPSRSERDRDEFIDSGWLTPEPMVRVNQIFLEPILFDRLAREPKVTILNNTRVEAYEQVADGVRVRCQSGDRQELVVEARFLAGCDGGRSTIRRAMGVRLVGDAELGRFRTSLVRSSAIRDLFGDRRPSWMSFVTNEKVRGSVVAIDGDQRWLLHRRVPRELAFDELDFDQSIRDLLGVGEDLSYEVISHEDWTGRRLVAERFRDGNVFLAGDAAHVWVPFAGYGMNAGIADGVELAWLLAAVVKGWASPGILAAYEAERLPITDQVSRLAMNKGQELADAWGSQSEVAEMSDDGEAGERRRAVLAPVLQEVNVPQFGPEGLNFGYYYDTSPIIAYDGESPPPYTMAKATPSTVPGCRMPHFWVDCTSIYDLLGLDYTLLRFDPAIDVAPLLAAASAAEVPLELCDASRPDVPDVFHHNLLIVRPDQHVAWRGDSAPDDSAALIDRLRGARS